jgi:uncharacterized membrane protein YkvA (DUF1232 family)
LAKAISKAQATDTANTTRTVLAGIAIILAIIYLIWPVDFIPDIIPVIGWIDDLIVIALAIGFAMNAWR